MKRPIKQPVAKSDKLVTMPYEVRLALDKLARQKRMRLNPLIVEALRYFLKANNVPIHEGATPPPNNPPKPADK